MTDLRELAERVEALEGPSREVDAEIAGAFGMKHGHDSGWCNSENGDYWTTDECAATYTASIDAAMTLVPEDVEQTHVEWGDNGCGAWLEMPSSPCASCGAPRAPVVRGDAATPALALCAASLRAKAGEQP